jgi:cytidylate kinase
VSDDLARRDKIDSGRAMSPLRPAPDAIVIDTDHMTVAQVIERVQYIAESA